jgi:DNA-binding NtrC family response regulator
MSDGPWITQLGLSSEPTLNAEPYSRSFQIAVGDRIDAVEKRLILATVQHTKTREAAAAVLGISVKTLYNRLRAYESAAQASIAPLPQISLEHTEGSVAS